MTQVADLCVETSNTMGVGTISLAGAAAGCFSFRESFADGAVVFYCQREKGGDREVCKGTLHYGTPDTLTRDTVLRSSVAGNAPVNWAGGYRMVYCCLPASQVLLAENALSEIADFLISGNHFSEIAALGSGAKDASLGNLGVTAVGLALVKAVNAAAGRTALGLGTAATVATGTTTGTIPVLTATGMPAVDGRALNLSLNALAAFYSGVMIQISTGGANNRVCRFVSYNASTGVLTVTEANGITGSFTPDTPAQLSALWCRGNDGRLYPPGSVVPFTGVAAGTVYYVGNAGVLTAPPTTSPTQVGPSTFNVYVRAGHALATNVLWFDPSPPLVQNTGAGLTMKYDGNYFTM